MVIGAQCVILASSGAESYLESSNGCADVGITRLDSVNRLQFEHHSNR